MQDNPYQAPAAEVADPASSTDFDTDQFSETPVKHSAGAGAHWLGQSWGLFTASPGTWILIVVVLMGATIAMQQVPLVGNFAPGLLYPILTGGLMVGCHELSRGQKFRFEHLFGAFGDRLLPMVVFAVLYFVAYSAASGGVMIAMLGVDGYWAVLNGDPTAAASREFWLAMLLSMVVSIPIFAAYWLAIPLIMLNKVDPVKAAMLSFKACLSNLIPLILMALLTVLLFISTILTLGLALLIVLPMMFASMYTSYRAIFYR